MTAELFRKALPDPEVVWEANDGRDKYTSWTQRDCEEAAFEDLDDVVEEYEDYNPDRATRVEIDHVVEVQVSSYIWDIVSSGKRTTRATTKPVRESINSVMNLNCTLGAVNMKKGFAIKEFLKVHQDEGMGLRDYLLDYGVQRNVTRKICKTFENAAHDIADEVQEFGSRKVYDDFADELVALVGHMHLH